MSELDPLAPDWYADPKGTFRGRYWDGQAWTERVNTGTEEAADPIKSATYRDPAGNKILSERQAKARADVKAAQANVNAKKQAKADAKAPNGQLSEVELAISGLASQKLDMRLGVNRDLKELAKHLHDGEELVTMARGQMNAKEGLIVVTNERVIFLDKRTMGVHFEDFPLQVITTISTSTTAFWANVRIHSGSHVSEIKAIVPKARAQEIVDAVRSLQSTPSAPVAEAPPATAAPVSKLDLLEQLGRLRDSGVLTDEEFEVEKRAILGS